jgi:hypothetical protein
MRNDKVHFVSASGGGSKPISENAQSVTAKRSFDELRRAVKQRSVSARGIISFFLLINRDSIKTKYLAQNNH